MQLDLRQMKVLDAQHVSVEPSHLSIKYYPFLIGAINLGEEI